jgi:triacylglycerol lipase
MKPRVGRRPAFLGIAVAVVAACTPASPAAPGADPVVIVAGTFAPRAMYEPMANRLRSGGYEVFIYTIPEPLDPFDRSAPGVAHFISDVVALTGRERVDVVGHSQGVILVRYAAKFLGSSSLIDTMVSLGGGIHGSDLARSLLDEYDCFGLELCRQAATGSQFQERLNSPSDALPGIAHVNVVSLYDQVSTPYWTGLMVGPGDIENVVVQDQCPDDLVDHGGLAFDGPVASAIDDALADRPVDLDCSAT